MTSNEPVFSFDELLVQAQGARPRFNANQLRDVVWRFLWSGKLDGQIGLNADAFLSAWVQPSDPYVPRIAISEVPKVRLLTTGNKIAEPLVTTLALSESDPKLFAADKHLYEKIRTTKLKLKPKNDVPPPLDPLASRYRQALALVPEHDRKDAPIVAHLLAHLKFSERAKQMIVDDIGSTAKLADTAEEACREWLVERMRKDQTRPSKREVEAEALTLFLGLTPHGFNKAWSLAAAEVPGSSMTKRGPKPRRGTVQAIG
jgi:hypothetical protein